MSQQSQQPRPVADATTVPPWAITLVGYGDETAVIEDIRPCFKPLLDEAGFRTVVRYLQNFRDPVRFYDVVYRDGEWTCRPADAPASFETLLTWCGKYRPQPLQPAAVEASPSKRELTPADLQWHLRTNLQLSLIVTAATWDPPNPHALEGILTGYSQGIDRLATKMQEPGQTFLGLIDDRDYASLREKLPGTWGGHLVEAFDRAIVAVIRLGLSVEEAVATVESLTADAIDSIGENR